ncbi:PAS domain S-box protein [Flammeovirgaceae bacterium SG7u.111]|nr:PAS domain S-box protein [Flammeovirgaceae bacterium SG7u.132]WPO35331.1 PAS domain S-box protein [Flammeovirgaceae bacterium SG7u.111]
MEKKHIKYLESTRSYKSLLIFILGFQAVVSTGWIVFDNYSSYVENESTTNLISVGTSVAGVLIVLLVWVLLDGSFRSTFRRFTDILKEKNDYQKEVNENNYELHLLEESFTDAIGERDFYEQPEYFTEKAAAMLKVNYASIWLLNDAFDSLKCLDVFNADGHTHEKHDKLSQVDHPNFFRSLLSEKDIAAEHTHGHPLLADLEDAYFSGHSTVAAFTTTLYHNSKPIGVCIYENKNNIRKWSESEIALGRLIAQVISLSYREHEWLKASTELREESGKLEKFFHGVDTAIAKFTVKSPFSTAEVKPDQVALLSESVISMYNDAFLGLFGLSQDEIVPGMSPLKHFLGKENHEELIQKFIGKEYVLKQEVSYSLENGETQYVQRSLLGVVEQYFVKEVWLVATDITTLRRRESFFDTINRYSSKSILVLDSHNSVIYENQAAKHAFKGLVGKDTFFEYIHEEDKLEIRSVLEEVRREQEPKKCASIRYRFAEGKGWSKGDTVLVNLESDSPFEGVMIEIDDVTERENQLVNSKKELKKLQMLQENIPTPISVLNRLGNIVFENQAIEAFYGYSQQDRVGRSGLDFIHSNDVSKVQNHLQLANSDANYSGTEQISFLLANGNWEKVELIIASLGGDPDFSVLMSFNKAVSGVSVSAPASTNGEGTLCKQVLQKANRVYVFTDANGKITFVNNACSSQLGFRVEELIGKSLLDFVPATEKLALLRNMQYLEADHSATLDLDLQFKHKSGNWAQVEAHGGSITKEKVFTGLLFQLDNVTEKKKEEKELSFKASFYSALVKNVSSVLLFIDEDSTIKYANNAVKMLFGYQPKDSLLKWVHSKHHEEVQKAIAETSKSKTKEKEISIKIMDKDGLWKKVKVMVINAEKNSSFKGFILEIKSIDGKSVEMLENPAPAFDSTENILFQTIKKTPDHLFMMLNDQGDFSYLEGDTERHLGLKKEDALNMQFRDMLDEMSAVIYDLVVTKLSKGKDKVIRKELQIKTPEQQNKWLYVSFSFVKKDNSIAVVGQNITNLKQSFATMEKDTLYVRWLLDNATESILLCNDSGDIFYQNGTARKLTPTSISSVGKLAALFDKEQKGVFEKLFSEATSAGRGERVSHKIILAQEGVQKYFNLSITNLLEVHGIEAIRIGLSPLEASGSANDAVAVPSLEIPEEPTEMQAEINDFPVPSQNGQEHETSAFVEEPEVQEEIPIDEVVAEPEKPHPIFQLKSLINSGASAGELQACIQEIVAVQKDGDVDMAQGGLVANVDKVLEELEEIMNAKEEEMELLNLNEFLDALLSLYKADFPEGLSTQTNFEFDGWIFADRVALFQLFAPLVSFLASSLPSEGEVWWTLDRNEMNMTVSLSGTAITAALGDSLGNNTLLQKPNEVLAKYQGQILMNERAQVGTVLDIVLPRNFRV